MLIAENLRQKNIAEYLLYMWQVEDIIRAFEVDFDKLSKGYISQFNGLEPEQLSATKKWYEDLVNMMHSEGVVKTGHLQICKNVLINLNDLHEQIINSTKFPYYKSAYYDILPIIVELRAKGDSNKNEFETCFEFLYGIMLLKMQKKEISKDTEEAVKKVSTFFAILSDYYNKNKENPLDL